MPPDSSPGPHATPDTDALAREVAAAGCDPSRQFGRYLVLSELGHGGMGVVYRAWDPTLQRLVAIKTLTEGPHASPELIQRFVIEARSSARLQHPGIIGVHEVGEHQGIHFIAMDLVAGKTLKHHLIKGMASRETLVLIRQVAQALAHAHAHGVIHRDVKPDNVVVNDEGRAILMDFGLAKDLGQGGSLTATGQLLGTPHYMAPEQIDGKPGDIGPAADLYALGATLYRGLCGQPPFTASGSVQLFKKVLLDTPSPLREINPEVPANLEALVLRCLEKEPTDRYPSAAALADDLGRFLEGRPLSALALPQAQSDAPESPGPPTSEAAATPAAAAPGPVATPSRLLTGPTLVSAATVCVFALMGLVAVLADRRQDEPKDQASATSPASGADPAVQVVILEPEPDHLTANGEVSVSGRVTAGNAKEVWAGTQQVEVSEGEFQVELSLDDGSHQLAVSLERAGEPLATVRVHVDSTAPLVAVTSPEPGEVLNVGLLPIQGSVVDRHLDSVQLADGTQVDVAENGAFDLVYDLPDQDGEVTVELVARDRVGNETRHPIRVVVDRSAPRIVLSHEASLASRVGAEVTLQGRVEDAHPAVLYVDGQRKPLEADGSFSVTLEATAEDTREVILQAEDTVGQRSPEQRVSIIADDTPPQITLETPPENLVTQESEVTVRGRVSDAHGIAGLTVQGQAVALASDGTFSTSVPVTEGETRIEVVAEDADGNRVTLVRLVSRDTSPPTITLEPDLAENHYGRSQIKITGHLDEPGCTLTLNGKSVEVEAGRFSATVRLVVGENTLVLEATDRTGNVARQEQVVHYARRKPKLPRDTWWDPTREQLAYAEQSGLSLWFKNKLGMSLVLIPPGKFLMGRPKQDPTQNKGWAETQHPVTLTQGYYMAATEVTHGQFRRFRKSNSDNYQNLPLNHQDQPVTFVSWKVCQEFCRWLTENHGGGKLVYRLPTEAEWEYACRAGTTTRYFWGTNPELAFRYANGADEVSVEKLGLELNRHSKNKDYNLPASQNDEFRVSAPVGSFQPNPWGLYDMTGNVREWCQDWMEPNSGDAVTDPTGPDQGRARVIRGGNWLDGQMFLEASRRVGARPIVQTQALGFRVVAVPVKPKRPSKR